MGSEVIIEVWRDNRSRKLYTRFLAYGRTLVSDAQALTGSPNGTALAEWAPLDGVVKYLQDRIPADLAQRCING